jgi:hypothetical protein
MGKEKRRCFVESLLTGRHEIMKYMKEPKAEDRKAFAWNQNRLTGEDAPIFQFFSCLHDFMFSC